MHADPHCVRPVSMINSRRQFLQHFGMGMGAVGLASVLGPSWLMPQAQATALSPLAPKQPPLKPKAKRVLHIFANGAPSHIDTFDPKPGLKQYDGKMIDSLDGYGFASPFNFSKHGKSGIEVSEVWPELSKHVDDMTVIRSMYTDIPDHIFSTYMMSTGQGRLPRPSMGAWLVYGLGSENQNLPGYIALMPGAIPFGTQNLRSAFLPGYCQGTHIDTRSDDIEKLIDNIRNNYVTTKEQRSQLDLVAKLNSRYHQQDNALESRIQSFELAFQMQMEATDAFNINKEPQTVRERYKADTAAGKQMLIARRLLERGVRVVQVWHTGWDHHQDIGNVLPKKCAEVDQPIAALLDDLKQSGLLEDTLIVWGGEFGRMPRKQIPNADIKASTPPGRDHNAKGFCAWLAGGGVKRGFTYGATDELGYTAVENKVHTHDLHATIMRLMGFDHEKLTFRYNGRDFRLTDVYGEVVHDIIA